MTINEAITNLTRYKDDHHSFSTDCIGQSMQLGIEALKECRDQYDPDHQCMRKKLPGETEE